MSRAEVGGKNSKDKGLTEVRWLPRSSRSWGETRRPVEGEFTLGEAEDKGEQKQQPKVMEMLLPWKVFE